MPAPLFSVAALALTSLSAPALATQPRHALVIGANQGPNSLETLRYAEDDARRMADVLTELGGFPADRVTVLYGPDLAEVSAAFDRHAAMAKDEPDDLFVFYYSGHADGHGLRMGEDTLTYAQLRREVRDVPSDVRVGVLDACRSGEITRIKGLEVSSPFAVDRGMASEGEAWLTATSADESAQESDALRGSFFTHALVSGLRGAADRDDGVVSLDEAYAYAYDRTVARSSASVNGTQHPAYDFRLQGRGDLPLTEVRRAEARLVLPESMAGQLDVLRAPDGGLMAEVSKAKGTSLTLGLPAGRYTLRLRDGAAVQEAKIGLTAGSTLSVRGFEAAELAVATRKGEADADGSVEAPAAAEASRARRGLNRAVERLESHISPRFPPLRSRSGAPNLVLLSALPASCDEMDIRCAGPLAEEAGLPDGPVVLRLEDGTILAQGELEGGARVGRWSFWYDGGQRLAEGAYADGKRSGTWTWWYESGTRLRRGTYEDGRSDGLWTEWYANGNRRQQSGYAEGIAHGRYISWYESGTHRREGPVRHGQPEGRWTFWHENGQRAARGEFHLGLQQGKWETWHENGQQESEGRYVAGQPDGRWKTWYASGRTESVGSYHHGQRDGRWRTWSAEGDHRARGRYEQGAEVGRWVEWSEDGGRQVHQIDADRRAAMGGAPDAG